MTQAPILACSEGQAGWHQLAGIATSVTTLVGSSSYDGGRVYAGSLTDEVADHLWSGRPGDASFLPVSDFAKPDRQVQEAVISADLPGSPTRVWVSLYEDGGVFGSRTGASQTFTQMGALTGWVLELASTPSGVFAAASRPDERGVWRWETSSQSWRKVNQTSFDDGAELGTSYLNVLASSADGRVLYLGTDTKGLLKSTDGGATWVQVWDKSTLLGSSAVRSVAVDPANSERVLVGLGLPADGSNFTGERGLRLIEPNQTAKTFFDAPEVDLVSAVAFSQKDRSVVYAATYGRGLRASYDAGENWILIPPPSERAQYLAALLTIVPPNNPACELLYAGASDGLWVRRVVRYGSIAYIPAASRGHDLGPR